MKVREIKKEDIKVGIKVSRKGFLDSIDMRYIEEVSNINTNGCYLKTGEFITEKSLIDNYLLLEEDTKTNDTKVMTYVGGSKRYVTNGKNYNTTKIGNSAVNFLGDDGSIWVLDKEYFVDPSEYRNKLKNDILKGTKHDQDKLKPSLLFNDFPHAIEEVLKVLKFGAEKYSEGNWLKVENGIERYRNAAHRHMLAQEEFDDESGLLHVAHEATSVLMLLELKLREIEDAK